MSYIGNPPSQVAFLTDTFSGNASTTAFTMSVAPAGTSSVLVAITGVLQDPSTYSVVGTTLTFSAAPPTGTGNISVRYLGIPASGVTTTAYRTVTEFTATAGQTTFTPPSYTVGFINVYQNGARLGSADYTATNGTTVVLASAASSGDLVTVESFLVSSVLNAIPATAGAVNSTYLAGGAALANIGAGGLTQTYLGANVAGNGPAFSAWKNGTNQTGITAGTFTKVVFAGEEIDTNNCFNNTGSTVNGIPAYSFMPNVAGYYQFNWELDAGGTTVGLVVADVYKNGTSAKRSCGISASSSESYVCGSAIIYLNGTTDYVDLYVYIAATGASIYGGSANYSYFQGFLARAA